MLQRPETWDTGQREMITGSGTIPRERSTLQSTKLKGAGKLKSTLKKDMEMQSLEFVQLVFSLVLLQHFLTVLSFLPLGMVVYILCHYMLELYDLPFYFDFIGEYS